MLPLGQGQERGGILGEGGDRKVVTLCTKIINIVRILGNIVLCMASPPQHKKTNQRKHWLKHVVANLRTEEKKQSHGVSNLQSKVGNYLWMLGRPPSTMWEE